MNNNMFGIRSYRALFMLFLMSSSCLVLSQEYQDHGYGDNMDQDYYAPEEDNLYANYMDNEQDKKRGGKGGGVGVVTTFGIAGVSWVLGAKYHSGRAVKTANKKAAEAQRTLYTRYVQDVSNLQTQNAELQTYIGQMTATQLNEEFLQADYDNDREVSRAEFELYKKQYLARHPDMSPAQFPRFEDFDPNRDGSITMKEHTSYYQQEGHLL